MRFNLKEYAFLLILLIMIVVSAGCITISPVTPTLSTSVVTQKPTLSSTETPSAPDETATSSFIATARINAIVTTVEPYTLAEYPSSDGKWSVKIIRYECANASVDGSSEYIAYEQVRLMDLSDGKEVVVADQIQNCGGLGAFGFGGLYWSPNNRYFHYNETREGQPDGGCGSFISFPIHRLDTETMEVAILDGGILSPDGQKLAMWHEDEIVIWDLDKGELGRGSTTRTWLFNGMIWWSQQSDSILFLQTEFQCAPNYGEAVITRLEIANFSQSLIAEIGSLDTSSFPAPPTGVFELSSYPPLMLEYDSALWHDDSLYATGDSTLNLLQAEDLRTCQITVHKPAKFNTPYTSEIQRIGRFNFTLVTLDEPASDFVHLFYLADQFIADYDLRRGAPIIEVGAVTSEWDECQIRAEEVISTLQLLPK